jgi:hypothetical protein
LHVSKILELNIKQDFTASFIFLKGAFGMVKPRLLDLADAKLGL